MFLVQFIKNRAKSKKEEVKKNLKEKKGHAQEIVFQSHQI
jgi:hypothetical protein